MENLGNDFQTTLSSPIANGATTSIAVVSGVGAPAANFRIRVDDELMLVTSVGAGTNWTVQRGLEGTTAMAHTSGSVVTHVLTAGGFAQRVNELIAVGVSATALLIANNLSDLQSVSAARSNLGLGSAALLSASSLLSVANNLSDVANAATAATNLGLGTASSPTHANLTLTSQLTLSVATGTAPLVVTSTTRVANLNASQLIGATWASPGAIGSTAPSTGAFTTLSASSTVSGAGFSTYLAAPPAIGGTTPAAGTFTPLTIGAAGSQAILQCDAANVLAQRNGTNAQVSYIYNTFTDASNYERVEVGANAGGIGANTFGVVQKSAGTGTARDIYLGTAGNTSIRFVINGAQVWRFATSGSLIANTDNAVDVGSAGANRPRNIFIAGGMGLKVKAGAIVDGDFTNPTDGMIALDSTNLKLWARFGGAWKSVVLA